MKHETLRWKQRQILTDGETFALSPGFLVGVRHLHGRALVGSCWSSGTQFCHQLGEEIKICSPRLIHASGVRNWIQGSCELWTRWRRIVWCSADHGFTESEDFVICFYSHWKGRGHTYAVVIEASVACGLGDNWRVLHLPSGKWWYPWDGTLFNSPKEPYKRGYTQ